MPLAHRAPADPRIEQLAEVSAAPSPGPREIVYLARQVGQRTMSLLGSSSRSAISTSPHPSTQKISLYGVPQLLSQYP